MAIMDSAKEAEFTKLILAGEPLSKKEQKKLATPEQPEANQKAQVPETEKGSNWVE